MSGNDPYDRAPCGLLVTEESGLITRVNRTLCAWLDYEPEALVGRKRFQDLQTPGCRIFHETHWMPLLHMQGFVEEVQLELYRSGAETVPVLVNAVRDPERRPATIEIALFVTHDRRKYEQELLRARRRAEQLLESERRAQGRVEELLRRQEAEAQQRAVLAEQLIGIVSHDLRSPLSAIVFGADLLRASETNSSRAQIEMHIAASAQRATRLTADLLDFTQARIGGGLRVNSAPINLHALVRERLEELSLAWPSRQIVHHAVADGLGIADADRISQVLTNLINNALTYGAPDRPITVTSIGCDATLELSVHNWGLPIPEALVPVVFEPLRRGEQPQTHEARSVGLGLYIVRQIARAHGGDVRLHSTLEGGTTFRVSFTPAGCEGSPLPEQQRA